MDRDLSTKPNAEPFISSRYCISLVLVIGHPVPKHDDARPFPPMVSPVLLLALTLLLLSPASSSSLSFPTHFESWHKLHRKTYSSVEEKLRRYRIYQENLDYANWHNSQTGFTYTLAANAFADLTVDEFRSTKLGLGSGALDALRRRAEGNGTVFHGIRVSDVPKAVDWRAKGAVTGVKDQGSCGDCWAFSATGAIEGINQIVTGSLVSLSEQELCDCDKEFNNGCEGGLMDYAFKWVIQNHGIDTEEDYPYQAAEKKCLKEKVNRHVVTIDGYTDIPSSNEDLLLQAVAKQPVSVGICGSERNFQLYSKGIFNGPCSTALDHAVLIVGYGSVNGVDYWIVKNSWGTRWGIDGYMHMLRNSGNSQGVCGINQLASYPTKTSPNPPSPQPGPTKCNLFTYCPAGSTCCCSWSAFGICLSWSCCTLESAVCCKDTEYCCPQNYPICDTQGKRCLKASQNMTGLGAMKRETSYVNFGTFLEAWNV